MKQQIKISQADKPKEITTRLERVIMLRDRLLEKIDVLVGADVAAGQLYPKVKAKIAELKETRPGLAEELELKYLSYESYCLIIFGMLSNPQTDTEIDGSKFAVLPKAKSLPLPPPQAKPPAKDSFDLKRLQKLLEKDTGWDPSKPAFTEHVDGPPGQKHKINAPKQIPD